MGKRPYKSDHPGYEKIFCIDDNEEALIWRLRMIGNAQESIILAIFDLRPDRSGTDIMAALYHAAKKGVRVQLLEYFHQIWNEHAVHTKAVLIGDSISIVAKETSLQRRTKLNYCIKNIDLAEEGRKILSRTMLKMPVLDLISVRFQNLRPFEGLKITLCKHLTAETAAFATTLKQGGADVYMAASNPKSTQDAVVAALVKDYGIHVFANSDETQDEYFSFMDEVLKIQPDLILDDGASILPRVYEKYPELTGKLIGTTEQTTSGVAKVEQMDKAGKLQHPTIAVNSSKSKHMYDNRYGVGQTFIEAYMNVMETMICGKTVVVCGFGYCGKGIAERAKGMGANVIVTEIDPFKALDAVMSGYRVMSLKEASDFGDVFVSVTGNTKIIDYPVMEQMKSGAVLINCGSGTTEINVAALKEKAVSVHHVKEHLDEYTLENGSHLFVVADGRVANLVCANGNPADVMDMSFSVMAFGIEYLVKNNRKLENHMLRVPLELDYQVVRLKLGALGINFDKQTEEQKNYARHFVTHE